MVGNVTSNFASKKDSPTNSQPKHLHLLEEGSYLTQQRGIHDFSEALFSLSPTLIKHLKIKHLHFYPAEMTNPRYQTHVGKEHGFLEQVALQSI